MIRYFLKTQKKPSSMQSILLTMMIGLTTATIFLFITLAVTMRLIPSLRESAYKTMHNQSAAQASRVGSELDNITRSLLRSTNTLQLEMDTILDKNNMAFADFNKNQSMVDQYLSKAFYPITELFDGVYVSGAFLILTEPYDTIQENEQISLYLRSATAVSTKDSAAGLNVLQGPPRLEEIANSALDRNWTYGFQPDNVLNTDFYDKPIESAKIYKRANVKDLSYWSSRFFLYPADAEIITYTMPIIGKDGIYGICGVEISLTNVMKLLPSGDLLYDEGFYLFGSFMKDSLNPATLVSGDYNGSAFIAGLKGMTKAEVQYSQASTRIYALEDESKEKLLGAIAPVELYSRNSPFSEEGYHLFVLAPEKQVLEQVLTMARDIFLMLVISVILSCIGSFILSRYFAKRIEVLAAEVKNLNPEKPVSLPRTRIYELDLLVDVVEKLNANVAAHAARLSTIVDSVGMPMGGFEINILKKVAFFTPSLFRLLELEFNEGDSQYIPVNKLQQMLPFAFEDVDENGRLDFCMEMPLSNGDLKQKWLRLHRTLSSGYVYGTILDITEEVENKKRLEYERNYDPLTKLLNRNAYNELMTAKIKEMPNKMGVFLFGDLDNLKTVNDTFGHDVGDRYILMAAEALNELTEQGGIVARISGDEFAAYYHGGDSRKELRQKIDDYLFGVRQRSMVMPDGNIQKLMVSVGLSYYPEDADNITRLMKFADYAMYEMKHSAKGGTQEFNLESFNRNKYILNKPDPLDYLLDQRRIQFAFQPIVEVKNGHIMGYEAFVRPKTREIHSPEQVITLAKNQRKLNQLEQVTMLKLLEWTEEYSTEIQGLNIFFNSLPNQLLANASYDEVGLKIENERFKLIMEVTAEEQYMPEKFIQKIQKARQNHMGIALDNFDMTYAEFIDTLKLKPDFIKIDPAIIKKVHENAKGQAMLKEILEYADKQSIKTIAEGIETYEELETVINFGATYVQGFYLCHPEFQIVSQLPKKIRAEIQQLYESEHE